MVLVNSFSGMFVGFWSSLLCILCLFSTMIPCGFYPVDLCSHLSFSLSIFTSLLLFCSYAFPPNSCLSELSKDEPIMAELLQGAFSVPVYLRYRGLCLINMSQLWRVDWLGGRPPWSNFHVCLVISQVSYSRKAVWVRLACWYNGRWSFFIDTDSSLSSSRQLLHLLEWLIREIITDRTDVFFSTFIFCSLFSLTAGICSSKNPLTLSSEKSRFWKWMDGWIDEFQQILVGTQSHSDPTVFAHGVRDIKGPVWFCSGAENFCSTN